MVDNTRIEETLSALMDSEAQELETRRVLKEMSPDSELRETWHRYQLASAAMKRDLPSQMIDLSAAISDAVDRESVHKPGLQRFVQPLGKFAVAASVTLVAVLGVQQIQNNPAAVESPQASVASESDDSGAAQFQWPAGIDLPPVSARTASSEPARYAPPHVRPTLVVKRQVAGVQDEAAIREYLNAMMERHTRNAANSSSNQGLLPLARLPQTEDN